MYNHKPKLNTKIYELKSHIMGELIVSFFLIFKVMTLSVDEVINFSWYMLPFIFIVPHLLSIHKSPWNVVASHDNLHK